MGVIDAIQGGRQLINRPSLQRVWLVIASLALLCLDSCKQYDPTPGSFAQEALLTPVATLVPIPSATARETATVGPEASAIPSPAAREAASSQPAALTIVPLTSDEIGRFEPLELEIESTITATNPFDPEELDIRVAFTSASGSAVEIGAFWYQEFDKTGLRPMGKPGWRARFTPTETGAWTAVARIQARGMQSEPVTFKVLPSDEPGFIRVHPGNPRYLAFDNGQFFFPIGLNLAWWSGAGDPLGDYRKWMVLFSKNGGNTIRVWMAEWSFGLEWNDTPLGDYTNRLRRAWLLDQIFAMAEDYDIYVDLVILNCADFNNWQTNGWNGNPYNAARGGPLEKPEEFVSDPTARALLQRRLNYIVNRWGYLPRLLVWEWWNEVNLAPFSDATLIAWLQEMTAYLRARDVNRHLTTNSYAIRDISPIWLLPELDIIQKHEYADQVDTTDRDLAGRVVADFERLAASAPAKPIILGEFGYSAAADGNDFEKTGIHLHNGIWATAFAGYAGSGMYWYWDIDVEANRLWYHFQGLNRFLADVDLTRYQPFSPLLTHGPDGTPGQAAGLGLRGNDVLIWLRSDAYTVQASMAAWQRAGSPAFFDYLPPLVEGQVLSLAEMADGVYTIHWFDPKTSAWLDPSEGTVAGGRLLIPIPDFRRDIAARIVPIG